MKKRSFASAALVGAAVAAALFAATASGAGRDYDACLLVPKVQLEKILGVGHIEFTRNIAGQSSPSNTAGDVHAACLGVGWSGKKPSTRQAALAALVRGSAAAFAIETWAPDEASQYVDHWTSTGYDSLSGGAIVGALVAPGLPAARKQQAATLHPSGFGAQALGIAWTPLPGVRGASASWWDDSSYSILAIVIGQSAKRPVVTNLTAIAKVAAANFGL